ncbi:hypothetical protein ACFCWG_17040 [Streptomyces sp. NPDC056390]|uniref:hypothetical protein n=1 Tax=Streptomyces sp. NPDC056390 TaxID=3345806 RepID=UPI0035DC4711
MGAAVFALGGCDSGGGGGSGGSGSKTSDAENVTVKGVAKRLVSTVKRANGTTRITLAGRPLYRYARDDGPKEAYGQGVDGTWFAATPTGAKAQGGSGSSSNGY